MAQACACAASDSLLVFASFLNDCVLIWGTRKVWLSIFLIEHKQIIALFLWLANDCFWQLTCSWLAWQVMPLLRQILSHANDKSHQMLRAKALECISLVGMAIGRDRFREDAHAVLRYMQSLQVHDPDAASFTQPAINRKLCAQEDVQDLCRAGGRKAVAVLACCEPACKLKHFADLAAADAACSSPA